MGLVVKENNWTDIMASGVSEALVVRFIQAIEASKEVTFGEIEWEADEQGKNLIRVTVNLDERHYDRGGHLILRPPELHCIPVTCRPTGTYLNGG